MEFILAVLGSMAIQGPLLRWVAQHRLHHQRSDMRGDPHSPHLHGGGFWGLVRGLWHAHLGWICGGDMPHLNRYIPDLMRSRLLRTVSSLFPLWVLLSMLVPTLIGGLWAGTWTGALLGFIWGGLVRVFCVHHVTWSVNSICHVWGTRPFQCDDQSRNNFVIGVLAFGEGWHNNHHAFPTSARHGLRWWQVDVSYLIIRAMALLGLAWNVKVASPRAMAASSRR
jgi:stearoyl-CoA desaturase (delta-9 desaturase)